MQTRCLFSFPSLEMDLPPKTPQEAVLGCCMVHGPEAEEVRVGVGGVRWCCLGLQTTVPQSNMLILSCVWACIH